MTKIHLGGPSKRQIRVGGPAHIFAASPVRKLISILGASLGAVLLIGGIYLAIGGGAAATKFTLFGNQFSSTTVGIPMMLIGAAMIVLTFWRILASVDHLLSLPDDHRKS